MKTTRFLVTLMSLLFFVCSCEQPAETPSVPEIQLGSTEIDIASDGAPVNVAYVVINEVTGKKITVTNEAEWLSVDTSKARMITFSAGINETGAMRKAEVVVSYEGAEDVILEVTQDFFESPLKITISDVTATGLVFSVTTSDETLTWLPMVTYKESFEYFETADELFRNDLEYFEYLADIREMTLEEFLEMMVAVGNEENVDFDGLEPSTDYVLYAYGVTSDGRRTTDIVHEAFRTEDPYEGDITFTFDAVEEDYILNYTITPSHTGVPYLYGIAPKSKIDLWKSLHGNDLREALQVEEVDARISELMDLGMISGPEDYYDIYNESNVVDWGYFELTGGTTYVLYAVKWDEQCRLTGPVSTYEHTSQEVAASENQITLEVRNVTQSSAEAVATVTSDDPYVVMPVRKSELDGLTDEELFVYLNEKYDYIISEYTFTGNMTKTYSRMRPDVEYALLAFGYKAGTMTTSEMQKVYFKTLPAGDPAECTFEFHVEPDVDNAIVEITPSDKGQFYHWLVYPSYYTQDDVKYYITTYVDAYYEGDYETFASWELSLGDDTATAWDLYPETEYKVGAVVMDYDTGEFLSEVYFSEPFITPAKTYAAIEFDWDYGPYYDIGELIRAGQSQLEPLLTDGDALMPLKVSIEGDCSAFYYALYANDLSDTEMYTDETFYAGLEGGGISYKSTNLIVKYDTRMTLVAVAYDYDNNPTQLYRDVLFFTQDGASPAKDFIATLPKSSVKAMGDVAQLEAKVASKRPHADLSRVPDMQARHEAAMAKVQELRVERTRKEMEVARARKSKFIAK